MKKVFFFRFPFVDAKICVKSNIATFAIFFLNVVVSKISGIGRKLILKVKKAVL